MERRYDRKRKRPGEENVNVDNFIDTSGWESTNYLSAWLEYEEQKAKKKKRKKKKKKRKKKDGKSMTITIDTANIGGSGPVASPTSLYYWTHKCGLDVDMLVVVITIYDTDPDDGVVSQVTYLGDDFTEATQYFDATADAHVSVWYLLDPTLDTISNIMVYFGGTVTDFEGSSVGVEGTLGSFELDSTGTPATGNGSPSISWTTTNSNTVVFDAAISDNKDPKLSADGSQVEIHNSDFGSDQGLSSYLLSSSTSVTMSWTDLDDDEDWCIVGAAFNETGAPPPGQPTQIRTQGVPTGSGFKDRPQKWN